MFERDSWESQEVLDRVGKPLPYHDPLIHRMVLTAIASGVTNRYVKENNRHDPKRALEMLGWYCFTPATLAEIAEKFPISKNADSHVSKQAVSQSIKSTLKELYGLVSDESKEKKKSWVPENLGQDEVIKVLLKRRKPISFIENGLDVSVYLLLQNMLPPSEIRKQLGIKNKKWYQIRLYWQRKGLEIPQNDLAWSEAVLRDTSPDELEWIQVALNAVTRRSYEILRGDEEGDELILPLSVVAEEAGLYDIKRNMNDLMASLLKVREDGGWIPVGRLTLRKRQEDGANSKYRYYFIDARHRQRAIERLVEDPSLESLRESAVKLLCGEWEGRLPSTYALCNGDVYLSISELLRERGVVVSGRNGVLIEEFFGGTHFGVPVFVSNGTHYLYMKVEGWEDQLEKFVKQRKSESGLV